MINEHMASTFGQKQPKHDSMLISKASTYGFLTYKCIHQNLRNVVYDKETSV
jgi:hypothetical protein